jgi:hypothetical protein
MLRPYPQIENCCGTGIRADVCYNGTVPGPRPFPSRDQISVVTAVIVLAYVLARFLVLPERAVTATLFGSALGFELSGPFVMLVFAAGLISAGSELLIRAHPQFAGRPARRTIIHWILPGATALVLGAALNQTPTDQIWWLGLAGSVVALVVVLIAEYLVVDPADTRHDAAALALVALAYLLALVLFVLLRHLGARAAVSAAIGGGVAAALALRLFALKLAPLWRSAFYAAVVGLICAEAIWALTMLALPAMGTALLALIPFYLCEGLAEHHLLGQLTRRVWIEYGAIGSVLLILALVWGRA